MVFIRVWLQTLPKPTWAYMVFCPCGTSPKKKCQKKKLAQHGFYKLLITDPSKGNLGLCGFLSMWIKPPKKMLRKKLAQDDFYKLLIRGPSKGNLGL